MPLDLTLKARLIIQIGLMAIFCFFEDGADGLQLLLEDDLEFLLLLEEGGFLAIGSDEGRLELLDFEEEGGESHRRQATHFRRRHRCSSPRWEGCPIPERGVILHECM